MKYLNKAVVFFVLMSTGSIIVVGGCFAATGDKTIGITTFDFGLGILKFGERDADFKSIFPDAESYVVGETGKCEVYDLRGDQIAKLMPWVQTDVVEALFVENPGSSYKSLTQITIGISSNKDKATKLFDEYTKVLGQPLKKDNMIYWKSLDGATLRVIFSKDHYSVELDSGWKKPC